MPRGDPKIINFGTLNPQGAQNGPRWASRAPKGCPNELQRCKMRSKMTSRGLQKEEVFANLTDLQHLKNASIPSLFLTTWRLRSGGRVHHTLSAADWESENWRALRSVCRPLVACPPGARVTKQPGHLDGTVAGFAKQLDIY